MNRIKIFAFGSNLDYPQMRRRCPSTRVIGPAGLKHHRLAFVGRSRSWGGAVATITDAPGKFTAGMVYSITVRDLQVLDACEGHPRYYIREYAKVQMLKTNKTSPVWLYRLDQDFAPPTPEYVAAIRRGYEKWGFDRKWLRNAIRFSRRRFEAELRMRLEAIDQMELSWFDDDYANTDTLKFQKE